MLLVAVCVAARTLRLTVHWTEPTVSENFDPAGGGQTKDAVPKQVTLRPPPIEESPKRVGKTTGRTHEDQDTSVLVREPVLAQEVPIVGYEKETARTTMNLGIGCVPAEAMFSLLLANLTKAGQGDELLGDPHLDVVVEQDERWLLGLSVLAAWHRLFEISAWCHGEGMGRCRSCPCP